MTARAFFIVSSGRSGTAMMAKALAAEQGVTIEHEYMVHIVQPLAVRRYQGLASANEARAVLSSTHGAALRYSANALWGDSSNKLSWLIPDLAALFPEARFVHLVRDGRKVASSYFHKLGLECYDDRSTKILAAHLADSARISAPAAGKEILVAASRGERSLGGRIPLVRPISTHRMALGGGEPGHSRKHGYDSRRATPISQA